MSRLVMRSITRTALVTKVMHEGSGACQSTTCNNDSITPLDTKASPPVYSIYYEDINNKNTPTHNTNTSTQIVK